MLRATVTWTVRSGRNAATAALLRRAALHAAAAEGFRAGELSIAVVGRRAMAGLHNRYLGLAGPTDVLSFDLGTDRRARRIEGEIVVCADVARRVAGAGTRGLARELALYVVHGVLHLAGYDDHRPRDFARMHAREDELLAETGLGPVRE